MQAKLHRWAAGPVRAAGFDDLFNLVCAPATLHMAFARVAGNAGARTAGSDGWTASRIESARWVAFRSHYSFDAFYCHPGQEGAHEKGGVEGEMGRFRRTHLVPVPEADYEFETGCDARGQACRWRPSTEPPACVYAMQNRPD